MSKDVRAGKAYVELGLRAKLDAGLQAAAAKLRAFGTGALAVGAGVTAAASAAFGAVVYAGSKFASVGDDIGKMAKRTGIGVEALQELKFAAQQSGASIEDLEAGTKKMQKVVTDAAGGMQGAADSLKKIGVTRLELDGKDTGEQLSIISNALAKVTNSTRKAAFAQEIFGKSGTKLLPLFNEGPKGLAALRKEAQELGLVLSESDVENAEKLNDAFGRSGEAAKAIFLKLGAIVATPLSLVMNSLAHIAGGVNQFIENMREELSGIIDIESLGSLVSSFEALFSSGLKSALTLAATVARGFLDAFGPLVKPLAVLASVGATAFGKLASFVSSFTDATRPLIGVITMVVGGAAALATAIGGVGAFALVLGVALPLVKTGLVAVAAALSAITVPALAVTAAIAGIGFAAYHYRDAIAEWGAAFWEVLMPVRNAVNQLWSIVKTAFSGIAAALLSGNFKGAAEILWAGVKTAFFLGAEKVVGAWDLLTATARERLASIAGMLEPVRAFFSRFADTAMASLGSAFSSGIATLRGLWSGFTGGLQAAWSAVSVGFKRSFESVASVVSSVMASAQSMFSSGVSTIQGIWSGFASGLQGLWTSTTANIAGGFQALIGGVGSIMASMSASLATAGSFFSDLVGSIAGSFSALYQDVSNMMGGIASAIMGGNIQLAGQILWASIETAFISGIGTVRTLWAYFAFGLEDVWASITNNITRAFSAVASAIGSIMAGMTGKLQTLLQSVAQYDPTGAADRMAAAMGSVSEVMRSGSAIIDDQQRQADTRRQQERLLAARKLAEDVNAIAAKGDEAKKRRDALITKANELGGEVTFGTLRTEAETKLTELVKGTDSENVFKKLFDELQGMMNGTTEEAAKTASPAKTAGTFSALGAQLLGLGGNDAPQHETARNTKMMAAALARMEKRKVEVAPVPKFS